MSEERNNQEAAVGGVMGPGWSDEGTLLRCLDAALKHGNMPAAAALIERLAVVAPDTAALIVDVLDLAAVSGG